MDAEYYFPEARPECLAHCPQIGNAVCRMSDLEERQEVLLGAVESDEPLLALARTVIPETSQLVPPPTAESNAKAAGQIRHQIKRIHQRLFAIAHRTEITFTNCQDGPVFTKSSDEVTANTRVECSSPLRRGDKDAPTGTGHEVVVIAGYGEQTRFTLFGKIAKAVRAKRNQAIANI